MCENILVLNQYRIKSLYLSTSFIIDSIVKCLPEFTSLQSFSLIRFDTQILKPILRYLSALWSLSTLTLICEKDIQNANEYLLTKILSGQSTITEVTWIIIIVHKNLQSDRIFYLIPFLSYVSQLRHLSLNLLFRKVLSRPNDKHSLTLAHLRKFELLIQKYFTMHRELKILKAALPCYSLAKLSEQAILGIDGILENLFDLFIHHRVYDCFSIKDRASAMNWMEISYRYFSVRDVSISDRKVIVNCKNLFS